MEPSDGSANILASLQASMVRPHPKDPGQWDMEPLRVGPAREPPPPPPPPRPHRLPGFLGSLRKS